MKFILFVEGHTEKKAIPAFLKKWLDERLDKKAGINAVRFDGWAEMVKDLPKKASMYLNGPDAKDIIGVIGLLDLYGPDIYPDDKITSDERREWFKDKLEQEVGEDRFKMFFAVHEVEAWLLSDPGIFPPNIPNKFLKNIRNPEEVNFDTPPAKLLDRLYLEKTKRHYKKVTQGKDLFDRLKPDTAYDKCPQLKVMLDEMLAMAKNVGL